MFSHVFTSVTDFDRTFQFYAALMQTLGNPLRFSQPEKPWAGWNSKGGQRPLFVICHPHDGRAHAAGNGQMVAFDAQNRQQVIDAYQQALALGGRCEGPPGLRPQYHADYFGAYLRDPDGNKICIVSHAAT